MPTLPLPENASLAHLKKQAKLVRKLVADGDDGAYRLLREFHPRFASASPESPPERFRLADAQLIVARLYGHPSWPKLREHLDLVDTHQRPDPADIDTDGDSTGEKADQNARHANSKAGDRFVALACVSYNGDHDPSERIDAAKTMLRTDSRLGTGSVAARAVIGDHRWLSEAIADDPTIVNADCGPSRWPPLLYCCYSRLEPDDGAYSTLAAARVLLDAGADPNAGFLWRGLVPPFTALTGAFGRGEADQPPHPAAVDLVRALLEAGADPNDGQALYNNGLAGTANDDPGHLQLLVEFGLGTPQDGPWYRRFGSRLTDPEELLYDELEVAAVRGLPNRMRFLAGLGLDLNRKVGRSRRTPWQLATDGGHSAVLDVLGDAGLPGEETSQ